MIISRWRASAAPYSAGVYLAIYFCYYNSAGDRQFCVKGMFQDKGFQRARQRKLFLSVLVPAQGILLRALTSLLVSEFYAKPSLISLCVHAAGAH
jgi:hypothetical protein